MILSCILRMLRFGGKASSTVKKGGQLVSSQDYLTVDVEAFCDALKCLHWLTKHKIPYTTNFNPLRDLCIDLGNTTCTYGSEQSIQKMLNATSDTMEDTIRQEVCASPYYVQSWMNPQTYPLSSSLG